MKNNKTEKNKNVKGFYIALGISALMIGSACYFSYKEGDSKYQEISSDSESSQYGAVDRKETNIPKVTTGQKDSTYLIVTTTAATTIPIVTEYAAEEITETFHQTAEEEDAVYEIPAEEAAAEQEIAEVTEITAKQPLKSPLEVIGEFSGQELVKNVTTGSWQTHNGTDYKAEIGDDVYSVTDGSVINVDNDALWGTVVTIQDEGGNIYRYCNLSKELTIQRGATVSAGDVIGSVGDTADIESALEPHLHIEVIKGGKYQNPADFID